MAIIGDFYLGPEPAGENPKENSFGQSENEKQRMRKELKNNNSRWYFLWAARVFFGSFIFWVLFMAFSCGAFNVNETAGHSLSILISFTIFTVSCKFNLK